MEDISRVYRIRTKVGDDSQKVIHIPLNQTYDMFEILSLNLNQTNSYKTYNSDYGAVVGRVVANGGIGVPNAKISIFIEVSDNETLKDKFLYNFTSVNDTDNKGIKYNLLPDFVDDACHQDVGTFPNKRLVLDNDDVLEMFDKYWKYTTTTNNSGDYMIFGVPTGSQTLHCDVDLSDCGFLSQRPRNLIAKGYNATMFESPNKFKYSTNLNSLAQIISQDKGLYVYPYWGDVSDGEQNIGITRCDITLEYKFEPTAVFIGSIITDQGSNAIGKNCTATDHNGRMSDLISGEGTIEMIRKTLDNKVEEYPIMGNKLIDGDGTWAYDIPMNLDYVTTDEFGNLVPTDNPNKGIATRARVRFRISLDETIDDSTARKRAKYLVPNNPRLGDKEFDDALEPDYEFGSNTREESFCDLFWNKVYTVKNYIPRLQKNSSETTRKHTGIKLVNHYGDNNPMPYNALTIKLNFTYRLICVITKAFIGLISFLNNIITLIGYLPCWLGTLSLPLIGKPFKFLLNVIPSCISISSTFCDASTDPKIHYPGCGEPKQFDCVWTKKTLPECKKAQAKKAKGEQKLCTNGKNDLDTCIENELAQQNDATSFNFYNDWINGVLYAPLWYRKITEKKRFFFGRQTIDRKSEWCSANSNFEGLHMIQTCSVKRTNAGKSYKNFENESITPYYMGDGDCGENCQKSLTFVSTIKGLIKTKETMLGQTVYYYTPVEYDTTLLSNHGLKEQHNGDIKLLFATDIVLLGSLTEFDLNGVPQFFKSLESTTYKLPEQVLFNDHEIKNVFDNNGNFVEAEYSTFSEMAGCDWSNSNEYGKKDGGVFYDIGCSSISLKTKSCINLIRQCEYGVSLDESKLVPNLNDINKEYDKLITDGFISWDELYNMDERSMFATMNGNRLKTKLNYRNGLREYDFRYLYPDNFDGSLQQTMRETTRKYDIKVTYKNNYVLEQFSRDYYIFRMGDAPYFYDRNRAFPRYENSYYFYFGLKSGKTAIDKFNAKYFAECYNEEGITSSLGIFYSPNGWCENSNEGYLAFDAAKVSIPFDLLINSLSNNDYSIEVKNITEEKVVFVNDFNTLSDKIKNEYTQLKGIKQGEGNVYVYDPMSNAIPMLPNGRYQGVLTDGDGTITEFVFNIESKYLTYNTQIQDFVLPNNILLPMHGNDYHQICTDFNGIDYDAETKQVTRSIGGIITIQGVIYNNVELSSYRVRVSPRKEIDDYDGVEFCSYDSDLESIGVKKYVPNDGSGGVVFGIGVPKGGVDYEIIITELCGDRDSGNSVSTIVTVNEPLPFKMFINDVDYDLIKNFNIIQRGGNRYKYTDGWIPEANKKINEKKTQLQDKERKVIFEYNPWFNIENIWSDGIFYSLYELMPIESPYYNTTLMYKNNIPLYINEVCLYVNKIILWENIVNGGTITQAQYNEITNPEDYEKREIGEKQLTEREFMELQDGDKNNKYQRKEIGDVIVSQEIYANISLTNKDVCYIKKEVDDFVITKYKYNRLPIEQQAFFIEKTITQEEYDELGYYNNAPIYVNGKTGERITEEAYNNLPIINVEDVFVRNGIAPHEVLKRISVVTYNHLEPVYERDYYTYTFRGDDVISQEEYISLHGYYYHKTNGEQITQRVYDMLPPDEKPNYRNKQELYKDTKIDYTRIEIGEDIITQEEYDELGETYYSIIDGSEITQEDYNESNKYTNVSIYENNAKIYKNRESGQIITVTEYDAITDITEKMKYVPQEIGEMELMLWEYLQLTHENKESLFIKNGGGQYILYQDEYNDLGYYNKQNGREISALDFERLDKEEQYKYASKKELYNSIYVNMQALYTSLKDIYGVDAFVGEINDGTILIANPGIPKTLSIISEGQIWTDSNGVRHTSTAQDIGSTVQNYVNYYQYELSELLLEFTKEQVNTYDDGQHRGHVYVYYTWCDDYLVNDYSTKSFIITDEEYNKNNVYDLISKVNDFIEKANNVITLRLELPKLMQDAFYLICPDEQKSINITTQTSNMPGTVTFVYQEENAIENNSENTLTTNKMIISNESDINNVNIPTITYANNEKYGVKNADEDDYSPVVTEVINGKKKYQKHAYYIGVMDDAGKSIPRANDNEFLKAIKKNNVLIIDEKKNYLTQLFDFPIIDKVQRVNYISWACIDDIPYFNLGVKENITMNGIFAGNVINANMQDSEHSGAFLGEYNLKLSRNLLDNNTTYIERRVVLGVEGDEESPVYYINNTVIYAYQLNRLTTGEYNLLDKYVNIKDLYINRIVLFVHKSNSNIIGIAEWMDLDEEEQQQYVRKYPLQLRITTEKWEDLISSKKRWFIERTADKQIDTITEEVYENLESFNNTVVYRHIETGAIITQQKFERLTDEKVYYAKKDIGEVVFIKEAYDELGNWYYNTEDGNEITKEEYEELHPDNYLSKQTLFTSMKTMYENEQRLYDKKIAGEDEIGQLIYNNISADDRYFSIVQYRNNQVLYVNDITGEIITKEEYEARGEPDNYTEQGIGTMRLGIEEFEELTPQEQEWYDRKEVGEISILTAVEYNSLSEEEKRWYQDKKSIYDYNKDESIYDLFDFKNYIVDDVLASDKMQYAVVLPMDMSLNLEGTACRYSEEIYGHIQIELNDEDEENISLNDCTTNGHRLNVKAIGIPENVVVYYSVIKIDSNSSPYPLNYVEKEDDRYVMNKEIKEAYDKGNNKTYNIFAYQTTSDMLRDGNNTIVDKGYDSHVAKIQNNGEIKYTKSHGYGTTGAFTTNYEKRQYAVYVVAETENHCRAISPAYDFSLVSANVVCVRVFYIEDGQTKNKYFIELSINTSGDYSTTQFYILNYEFSLRGNIGGDFNITIEEDWIDSTSKRVCGSIDESQYELIAQNHFSAEEFRGFTEVFAVDYMGLTHKCYANKVPIDGDTIYDKFTYYWRVNVPEGQTDIGIKEGDIYLNYKEDVYNIHTYWHNVYKYQPDENDYYKWEGWSTTDGGEVISDWQAVIGEHGVDKCLTFYGIWSLK